MGPEVTIGQIQAPCGSVSGRVFNDSDQDCVVDPGADIGLRYHVLTIEPGPAYAITDAAGDYYTALEDGSYTIAQPLQNETQLCPGDVPVPFTVDQDAPDAVVDLADSSVVGYDLVTHLMQVQEARPGFMFTMRGTVTNISAYPGGNRTVTLTYDPVVTPVSISPTPVSTTAGSIQWSFPPTAPFEEELVVVPFAVPADIGLLGQVMEFSLSADDTAPESDDLNNMETLTTTIVGSYDPNDKIARTSSGLSGSSYYLDVDEYIDYTIRFQNTGTATAQEVVVRDTLEADLDPASLEILGASHNFTPSFQGGRTLVFTFANISLMASGMNEVASHGSVRFRIKPRADITAGEMISNTADIYFDANPPVITTPSVLNVVSPVWLSASAWLGGAYDAQAGLMYDSLRASGVLPLTEPYTALGYAHTGGGGGENIVPGLLSRTGPTAIVDWVLLELRDPTHPATVLHSRSALLRRDGQITDKDGIHPVAFNAPAGNYRVALRHRNHLGVLSATSIALGSTATTWDVRTTATPLSGTNPTFVAGGVRRLWPGDGTRDGKVRFTGSGNDSDPILVAIGGEVPTNDVHGVYDSRDINLDGTVRFVGARNDRDIILQTIGGMVPTAVRVQQLP
jgi:uncharacterized repeat protein (TIGR01451 family)